MGVGVLTYIKLFNTLIYVFFTKFVSYISRKIHWHFMPSVYDNARY